MGPERKEVDPKTVIPLTVYEQQMYRRGPVDQISAAGGFGAEPSCAVYTAGSIYSV